MQFPSPGEGVSSWYYEGMQGKIGITKKNGEKKEKTGKTGKTGRTG
jgi:hypothetical protein